MASGVAPIEPTPLVSRTHTPRMQRIADQVGGRLVYIVITALIILPVWVATQSHMAGIQEAAPLDLPADQLAASAERSKPEIGRAPCREKGCRYVKVSVC